MMLNQVGASSSSSSVVPPFSLLNYIGEPYDIDIRWKEKFPVGPKDVCPDKKEKNK